VTDHTESKEICENLHKAAKVLVDTADDVGVAKQVRELASERRKNLLAFYQYPYLKSGKSAVVSEVFARNESGYLEEFEDQAEQSREAEKVIARNSAQEKFTDAARSLLSFSKSVKDDLQG
jgi:uncharacterized protein (UPF0147 family)